MSAGVGFRRRAIDTAAALSPSHLVEFSRLIDNGMVFHWDASGPLAGREQFVNALPEFTYLALDAAPVRLYIKRTRPGVRPAIWDAGPAMPDFTLQQFLDSEAAAAGSAQDSKDYAESSAKFAGDAREQVAAAARQVNAAERQVGIAAGYARNSQDSADDSSRYADVSRSSQIAAGQSSGQAAFYAAQALAAARGQAPVAAPIALRSLLQVVMVQLPKAPPDAPGLPWLNDGVLAFTPSTPEADAAAVAAAAGVNQSQLNPVNVLTLLQGIAAILPKEPPDGSGVPWNNNGFLALTS